MNLRFLQDDPTPAPEPAPAPAPEPAPEPGPEPAPAPVARPTRRPRPSKTNPPVPGTASELTDGWASDVGLGFSSLGLVVGIVALVVGFLRGQRKKSLVSILLGLLVLNLGSVLSLVGDIDSPSTSMCAVSVGLVELGYLVVLGTFLVVIVDMMNILGMVGVQTRYIASITPIVVVAVLVMVFFVLVSSSRCYDATNVGFSVSWVALVVLWIAVYFSLRRTVRKLDMVKINMAQQLVLGNLMKVSILATCLMTATFIIFAIEAIPYDVALMLLALGSFTLSIFTVTVLRAEIVGRDAKVPMGESKASSSFDPVKPAGAWDVKQVEAEPAVQAVDTEAQAVSKMYSHTSDGSEIYKDTLSAEQISNLRQNAFLITKSSLTGFEEYVDRSTGDSFWLDPVTRSVRHDNPQGEQYES